MTDALRLTVGALRHIDEATAPDSCLAFSNVKTHAIGKQSAINGFGKLASNTIWKIEIYSIFAIVLRLLLNTGISAESALG